MANPIAKVLAFDINRQLYTSSAINGISKYFPDRVVTLITGDSTNSVPNFAKLLPFDSQFKCDIIFIDGAHTYDIAMKDIINMRQFANQSNHILLIDDIGVEEVRNAVNEAINRKLIIIIGEIRAPQQLCNIGEKVMSGPRTGSFHFRKLNQDEGCEFFNQEEVEDIVYIAKYI